MSVYRILEEAAASQGWSIDSQLGLALEYIANQQADDAFEDFLQQYILEDENDYVVEDETYKD